MRRRTALDVAGIVVGTLLLRLPAYLARIHLTFDDGVYGASAVAMRAGFRPYSEVFSSQGPLFLPLVWLGDLAGLRTASSPRLLAVLSGVVLALAVYGIGRRLGDRGAGLLAAGLTTTGIGVLGVTGPEASDGPALAAAVAAIALAVHWKRSPSTVHAVAVGAVVGVALSIKTLVLPAVVPVALVLLAWRRARWVAAAAGTAVALHLLAGLPWGWADVWDQAYAYHLEVAGDRTPVANLAKVASTLGDRDLPLLVGAALALLVVGGRLAAGMPDRPAPDPAPRSLLDRLLTPDGLVLTWLGTTLLLLVVEHPLWRPHIAHLVPAGALLVALNRPRWPVLAVGGLVVLPYYVVHAWPLLHPDGYRPSTQAVVDAVRALPDRALAISDDPGIVWRAGRRTPPDLVDASVLRIQVGDLDAASVARAAAAPDVCAVAVRSSARWGSFDDLGERLSEVGYEPALTDTHGRVLYLKDPCRP